MAQVLVVEDDDRVARFLAGALRARADVVDVAPTGPLGLERALNTDYAMILLNLRLPGLSGEAVLQRTLAAKPDQPVIMLAGPSSTEERVRCLENGAVDVVGKPFSLAELLARIDARLCRIGPAGRTGGRGTGTVTLEPMRRRARYRASDVGLTEREFQLLAYLVRRAPEVASRRELLEGVWGRGPAPTPLPVTSTLLQTYVSRLRHKLGDDVIETVHGTGYRLGAA